MNKVIKATNFKADELVISENIRTNKYNGKSVYINHKNAGILRLQFPEMKLPFGVSKYVNPDKPEEVRFSLELAFNSLEDKVLKELEALEEKVIDYVEKNSKELFKKQKSREVLKDAYKSFIRYYHDEEGNLSEKYAPRLKVKIYLQNGNFQVDAYESVKVDGAYPKIRLTESNVDEKVGKGSACETILQCTGIWVVGQSFGVSWVLNQIKIRNNENKLAGYAFAEDEETEETGGSEAEDEDEDDFRNKRTREYIE